MRALEAGSWWNAAMRDVAAMFLRRIDLPHRGLMLDAGCGSGQTMRWFSQFRSEWRCIGLDVSWHGVATAAVTGAGHVCLASVLKLPLADESVDLALSFDVIQHLPLDGGDVQALSELHRVIKRGGHLLIRTNAQSFPRTKDDATFNFHKYLPREIRVKLQQAGFHVVCLSRLNALLGLAEIPRELRARRTQHSEYYGLMADPAKMESKAAGLKRAWLALEGRLACAGWHVPFGRTIVALCRA
jgi:SAM-dependent methyltransferase